MFHRRRRRQGPHTGYRHLHARPALRTRTLTRDTRPHVSVDPGGRERSSQGASPVSRPTRVGVRHRCCHRARMSRLRLWTTRPGFDRPDRPVELQPLTLITDSGHRASVVDAARARDANRAHRRIPDTRPPPPSPPPDRAQPRRPAPRFATARSPEPADSRRADPPLDRGVHYRAFALSAQGASLGA